MAICQLCSIQKEVKSNPKQSCCKKVCDPQEGHRCEIQGGGQEAAVMVG